MSRGARPRFSHVERALLALLCAGFLGLGLRGVGEYWLEGHEGWTAAQLAISAVNTARFGPLATRFARTDFYTGATPPSAPEDFWPTYSPLESLLLAGVFRLAGPHEWAARGVYLLIAAGTLLLVARLVGRVADGPTAIVAVGALALLPAFVVYGHFVTYDVPSLAAVLLVLVGVQACDEAPTDRPRRWRLWAATALAVFWGYHIHFLVPALVAYRWRTRRRVPRGFVAAWAVALAAFVLHAVALRGPGFFVDRLRLRAGMNESFLPSLAFVQQQLAWLPGRFTPLALTCAAAGALLAATRLLRRRSGPLDEATLVLLAMGIGYLLVFKNLASIHDYVQVCLAPGIALAAATAVAAGARALGPRRASVAVALLAVTWVAHALPRLAAMRDGVRRGRADVAVAQAVAPRVAPGERILHTLDVPNHLAQFRFYLRDGFRFVEGTPLPAAQDRRPTREEFRRATTDPAVRFALLDVATTDPDLLAELLGTYGVEELHGRLLVDLRAPAGYTIARPVATPVPWWWHYLVSNEYPPVRLQRTADPDRLALLLDQAGIAPARLAGRLTVGTGPANRLPNPTAALGFAGWTRAENAGTGRWDFVADPDGKSAWSCRGFSGSSGHTAWVSDPVRVQPGTTYTLAAEVWTGGQTAGSAAVRVDWFDAGGALIAESEGLPAPRGQPTWTPLTATRVAPPGATSARVLFYLRDAPATTDTRFRNLVFARAGT